ncbi:MAG: bifunctional folylpolyglutamate synthase/dihydrofolate synthase [Prevotellaceae bacterium]|jgi:dihydrofolate synthase/folylpolyglutamate synthase|nr:bifunctional folylpolyglutamate synthase/dihydrofolate synthase [Prevotellaceae bacterium]
MSKAYDETLQYLYACYPVYQQIGDSAYKEGLGNSEALDSYFHHPHRNYKTIHVGGTNGKGSVSHTLAAILQVAGYQVGLYTSPHLLDFSERIRVNGHPIEESYVIDFTAKNRFFFESLQPSFFELTTAMAFAYFADRKVDVAVIEVGLGGRLDCTNLILPDLSVITSISKDHTKLLGNRLADIAREKAGIIKPFTPVVLGTISDTEGVDEHKEALRTILQTAISKSAPLIEARANCSSAFTGISYEVAESLTIGSQCQKSNAEVIEAALSVLAIQRYHITTKNVDEGVRRVCELTGLRGRWEILQHDPLVICDIAHNEDGIQNVVSTLRTYSYARLHIVIGVAEDKDVGAILSQLPDDAIYYFTQASVVRALPAKALQSLAKGYAKIGEAYSSVEDAFYAAKKAADPTDLIFIGGSNFVVADLLREVYPTSRS